MKQSMIAVAVLMALSGTAYADCGGGNGSEDPPSQGCQQNGGNGGNGGQGGNGGAGNGGTNANVGINGQQQGNYNDNRDANAVTGINGQQQAATANGVNRNDNRDTNVNGQQQGIDRSGNSAILGSGNSDNTNRNNNTAAQGQVQGILGSGNSENRNTTAQGQGQSQGNVGINGQSSRNTMTGGANTNGGNTLSAAGAGQGAGAGAGSNNHTTIDASDRSSNTYRATAWAPVIHGAAAPALAGANIVMYPGVCGPRHELRKVDVNTIHRGIIFDSEKKQGYDYTVVAAEKPFIERDGYLMGHQVIEYTAVIGTSSGGSFSLGGFGSNGNGGQGGVAGSGSVQQVVQRISLRECVYAMPKAVEVTREVLTEVPAKKIRQ